MKRVELQKLTFLVGLSIGAGLALLLAPNDGTKNRHILKKKLMNAKDKVHNKAEDVKNETSQTIKDAKQQIGNDDELTQHTVL